MFTSLDTNKKVELARLCGVNASDSSKKVILVHMKVVLSMARFCMLAFCFSFSFSSMLMVGY